MKAWMILGAFIAIYIGITAFNIKSKQRFLALKNEYNKMAEDRELYGEYGIDEASFMKKQDKLIRMLENAHLNIQSEYAQSDYIKNARKSRKTGIPDLSCKKLDDRREAIERALSQIESGQPLTEDIIIRQIFEPWKMLIEPIDSHMR